MQLSEYRAAIDRRTGRFLSGDALNDLVNEALGALSLEARWPWLDDTETVAAWPAGTDTHTMDGDWQAIKSITEEESLAWRPGSQRDVDGARADFYVFAVSGSTVTLFPAPGDGNSVVIRGTRNETELAADADEPLLPDPYRWALIEHACALAFDRHGDQKHAAARYARHMAAYDGWIARMKRAVRDQAQGPRLPRVRPGGGL